MSINVENGQRSTKDASIEVGLMGSSSGQQQQQGQDSSTSGRDVEAKEPVCERRHLASTAALCACTFVQAYLLISVFPYAGYLCIDLIPGLDEENAGPYAGLVASSFMLGRSLSSYGWGVFADTYGRKPALNWSLASSAIFSLLFGLSPTMGWALVSRFFLGFGNGIVGTAKTAVTELARGDARLETRGTGLVIGMRSYGFLLSPAVGGWLAEPLRQYPDSATVRRFEPLLARFPFILPNLVGTVLCVLAALSAALFVEETLPREKRRDVRYLSRDATARLLRGWRSVRRRLSGMRTAPHVAPETRCLLTADRESVGGPPTDVGTPNNKAARSTASERGSSEGEGVSLSSIWRRQVTRQHILAYWIFSFVVVCVDEAFPLFCISREGGLSLSEASIGKILSTAGLLFVLGQYYAFATLVNKIGLYPSLTVGALLGVPIVAFIPISTVLNGSAADGELTSSAFIFLSLLMAASKIFSCLFFAGITMATNRTVPTSYRASANGLAMLGGSVTKGLGPIFAGVLVAFSMSSDVVEPRYGSVVIFSVISLLGVAVVAEIGALSGTGEREG